MLEKALIPVQDIYFTLRGSALKTLLKTKALSVF